MIDLHMHSSYSNDGEFSPLELVEMCAEQGIDLMSITDHNCVRANKEAVLSAEEKNITYIPGIEIDCTFEDTNFHMLGYGVDDTSGDFYEIEEHIRAQGLNASLEMLKKTQDLGFHITETEMWNLSKDNYWKETWTGEMFAEILLSKPEYTGHSLLKPYRRAGARGDNPFVNFYWDYYSQGRPCHVEIAYPSMQKVVAMIHRNHGIAVLAHPCVNLKGKRHLMRKIMEFGIDGIEAFSSYHSTKQAADILGEAERNHLVITCGSDFHGKTKPSIFLGGHNCSMPETEIRGRFMKSVAVKDGTSEVICPNKNVVNADSKRENKTEGIRDENKII
ncbi:PHP domain-containing protein [Lachnospiraceae bacterium]|nr:PHP domain-containing protein [Lachnospiraceae bacterium]